MKQLSLHIEDCPGADLDAVLVEALPWMAAAYAEVRGARVLVHCAQGRSRSASLVFAWLMCVQRARQAQEAEKEEAVDSTALLGATMKFVKQLRSSIQPNQGFMRALERLFDGSDRFQSLWPALRAIFQAPGGERWQLSLELLEQDPLSRECSKRGSM